VRLLRLKIYTPAAFDPSLEADPYGELQDDESFGGTIENDDDVEHDLVRDASGDGWIARSKARRIAPWPTSPRAQETEVPLEETRVPGKISGFRFAVPGPTSPSEASS
jgi:hypothetical protein